MCIREKRERKRCGETCLAGAAIPLVMLLSRTTSTTWGLHNTHIHALPHTLSLYHFLCDTLLLIFVLHLSPRVFHSFSHTLPLWKWEARGGGGHSAAVQPKARSFGSLNSNLCAMLVCEHVLSCFGLYIFYVLTRNFIGIFKPKRICIFYFQLYQMCLI